MNIVFLSPPNEKI